MLNLRRERNPLNLGAPLTLQADFHESSRNAVKAQPTIATSRGQIAAPLLHCGICEGWGDPSDAVQRVRRRFQGDHSLRTARRFACGVRTDTLLRGRRCGVIEGERIACPTSFR